jgi:hypothetical protein
MGSRPSPPARGGHVYGRPPGATRACPHRLRDPQRSDGRGRQQRSGAEPDRDHALVVFLRPGRYGGAIQAAVYDEETIVGVSSANTAIAYPATPGPNRFMMVPEAADFLAADLRAGRVYYARVAPRMGGWRARFSLLPIDPRGQAHDLAAWLRHARLVTMTEKTHRWDAENHASVRHKKVAFLRRWEEKLPPSVRPCAPRTASRRTRPRGAGRELALLMEGSYVTRQVTGNHQAARIGRRAATALIERQLRRPPIPALRHRRRSL